MPSNMEESPIRLNVAYFWINVQRGLDCNKFYFSAESFTFQVIVCFPMQMEIPTHRQLFKIVKAI